MEKSLFKQLDGRYEKQDNYLIPCLTLPTEKETVIGVWGCGSPVETSDEVRSTDRAGR